MEFEITAKDVDSSARAGVISTSRGIINTPVFMPVGTAGTVKSVQQRDLESEIGAQIILGNTYHLYLRPGLEILKSAGGLHNFMNWKRPILTDSGGYQVFSLSGTRKITRDGVIFFSHIDGSKHFFTPEKVIEIQRIIGADIIMAFDECPPAASPYEYAKESMDVTHSWLDRCFMHFHSTAPLYGFDQSLFPIVQGGVYRDLRLFSAEKATSMQSAGIAIGGLSVGEPTEVMYEITGYVCEVLPESKPRYLMGVGTPENILECISLGIDMFDCVMPTRNARNGMLFTMEGIINIRNEKWKNDFSPIDENGMAHVDNYYSKAYLRHLFVSNEMLGPQIASIHNLHFYITLVKVAREKIINGTFHSWKEIMKKKISSRL